jgi:hypothetical protein
VDVELGGTRDPVGAVDVEDAEGIDVEVDFVASREPETDLDGGSTGVSL